MQRLTNKWALITGASRGVGEQIARALAREGCNLILHSRKTAHSDKISKELRDMGATVYQIEAELSEVSELMKLCAHVDNICSCPDIVYNNAAIMTPYHEDWTITKPDEYFLSFMVNTVAPTYIANHFIKKMINRGSGRIVQLTSGIADQPELMAYAASKAALDKVVRDTAPKLKNTGVTMNLLDPGWLRTDLGGPNAPGSVESVIPGALVPLFEPDTVCGAFFNAQDYKTKG